jgi:hypothetical protein
MQHRRAAAELLGPMLHRRQNAAPRVAQLEVACRLLVLSALCLSSVSGHEAYLALNPNGLAAPFGVKELGHIGGTDSRNPYGAAFSSSGRQYTPALCALDSDDDTFTNGFEMGDECCLWSNAKGCDPAVLATTGLSFPGDPASTPTRPRCDCVNGSAFPRCACCAMAPCSPGSGGGGDDDDVPKWVWGAAGGGAVAVAAGVGAWCIVSRRKRRAAAAAASGSLQREEESLNLYTSLD